MRAALAVFIALPFAIVFIVSFIALRTVDTVASPDRVAGIIEGSGLYDFVYDEFLDAAVSDVTEQGFDFEGGPGGGSASIRFRDPEAAAVAIKSGIDTLAGKEYVKAQVREALSQMIPYWTGRTDSFELNLDTADRIRTIPIVVRTINEELDFGTIVTEQLVAPNVVELSRDLTLGPFGIAITESEAEDAAARIIPPEWVNEIIYESVDQMAPYLAGDADTFTIVIPLRDRVIVVAQVLKEKLQNEATAGSLVISKVAGPLIAAAIGESNTVGFDIELTTAEIEAVLEQVAPPEWVIEQANNVIDTLVAYLTGDSESLTITVDLSDRKDDTVAALTELAESKLRGEIASLPECQSSFELTQAALEISAGMVPSCAPQGSEAAVPLMMPYVEGRIAELIYQNMPDSFAYSDAEFRSTLGEDQTTVLDDARELIVRGISFTEQDLVSALAGGGEEQRPEDVESFRETLDQVRNGFSFTDSNLRNRVGEDFEQIEEMRERVGLAYTIRYLLYLLPLTLLAAVAFIGGHGWRGRGMWGGMTLFIVSLVLLLVLLIGSSLGRERIEPLLGGSIDVSEGMREDFPRLAELLDSRRVQELGLDTVSSIVNVYRDGIIPFMVAGAILFLVAAAYKKYGPSIRGRSQSETTRATAEQRLAEPESPASV